MDGDLDRFRPKKTQLTKPASVAHWEELILPINAGFICQRLPVPS